MNFTGSQWHRGSIQIATLTHKILSTGTPSYLSSLLSHYKPTRQLRSSSSNLLVQPPSKTKFGSLAFHAAAPLIWNGLPTDVRSSPSFQTFKKNAQKSLFPQPSHLVHVLIPLPQIRFDWPTRTLSLRLGIVIIIIIS